MEENEEKKESFKRLKNFLFCLFYFPQIKVTETLMPRRIIILPVETFDSITFV